MQNSTILVSMPRKRPPPPKDFGVIELIQGTDHDGDEVYAYISIPLADYPVYKEVSARGEMFDPTEFGTLLAHGKGEPPKGLARKLAAKYDFPPDFESVMND